MRYSRKSAGVLSLECHLDAASAPGNPAAEHHGSSNVSHSSTLGVPFSGALESWVLGRRTRTRSELPPEGCLQYGATAATVVEQGVEQAGGKKGQACRHAGVAFRPPLFREISQSV